jgi:CubicO group peptidase (beta-lactamase class C family)
MKRFVLSVLLVSLRLAAPAAGDTVPPLPRSTPEAEGISSAALVEFIGALEQKVDAVHSIMIVRHGHVVAEGWWSPYAPNEPHILYSLSKSFNSTAVGLAQAEGKLSVNDPVLKFFPEAAPANPSDNLKAMRIADLLRMSTGHHADDIDPFPMTSNEDLVRRFLSRPVTDKPGTHFHYNSAASYMLSAIVQKVTGQTVLDYLRPRLFEPLGIADPTWEASAQGICFGAFGLSVRTEDIARFGQLYLQKGEWRGRRLLPAEWVESATSRQTSNGSAPDSNWDQGYGYQFWMCPHGFYRGDGAFGQLCIVMPQLDTVIAVTCGTRDMATEMNVIWDRLWPELRPAPLPAAPEAQAKLAARLAGLVLPTPQGAIAAPAAVRIAGRRYTFAPNDAGLETLSLETAGDGHAVLHLRVHGLEQQLSCGFGSWTKGAFVADPSQAQLNAGSVRFGQMPVAAFAIEPGHAGFLAAAGAWTADDTFTVKVCQYRTTFIQTIRLKFSGDDVTVDTEQNVSFADTKMPTLTGHAK